MVSHTSRFRRILGLAAGVLFLSSLGTAPAQSLSDGFRVLDDKYRKYSSLLREMFKGTTRVDPNDPQHADAIDTAARYATYTVYLNHLEGKPGAINKAFGEVEKDIESIKKDREQMQALGEVFRDKLRIHAEEVLKYDKAKPIHKIHNARILAKAAEMGQGKPLAETLVAMLQDDKQNDGVHFWILRGLRTLLAQVQPGQTPPLLSKDDETKCAAAILDFLNRKTPPSAGASQEEKDGFLYLRREAVRALAQIRTPSFNDKVRPALVLARFAGDDERIQPPPTIDERLEAAIGLARMVSGPNKDYQPDYAAGQVAKSLGVFVQKAEAERSSPDRTKPWRVGAARLNEALAALKADSGGKDKYITQVVDRGTKLLQAVERGAQANTNELTWFTTSQSDPPSRELFKGAADTAVKPVKPAEAEK
jgi:hypothetical protein